MSKKRAFICDSSIVSNNPANNEGIHIQPLYIIIDEVSSKDYFEMKPENFYDAVAAGKITKTSQPAPGDFIEIFEKIKADGVEEVFVFLISSGISGTFQTAQMAKEMFDGIDIHVIDTKTTTAGTMMVLKEVFAYAKTDATASEIIEYSKKNFASIDIYAYIGDLEPLRRGGRLSAAQATFGNMLQIKPIITVNHQTGEIDVLEKLRTEKKTFNRVMELVESGTIAKVCLLKTTDEALFARFEAVFKEKYPSIEYEVEFVNPVVGAHVGLPVTGIAVQRKI